MTRTESSRGGRAVGNRPLLRIVATQFLGGTVEWALVIALLVHSFERGGAKAAGLASLAAFTAPLAAAPLVAVACASHRLQAIRRLGLAACAVTSAAAGGAALVDLPLPLVVGAGMLAVGSLTVLAATGSSLVPAAVRTPRELVVANLWLGHCSAIGVLVGPLFASGLLALGSPSSALLGCAALAALAVVVSLLDAGPPAADVVVHPVRDTVDAARSLLRSPGGSGLIAVSFARHTLIGAFDVLTVVIAFDALDIGGAGAGLLNAAFGAGAVLSLVATSLALRATRLAVPILVALVGSALLCVLLAAVMAFVPAVVILGVIGVAAASVNTLSRLLLQRSVDPRSLGQVFGFVALVDGVALLVGSTVAQVVLAVSDITGALVAVGGLLALVSAVSGRSVWRADAADVPVVQMSLLRPTPVFAPLPAIDLESLARASTFVDVAPDEVVIRQGDSGDRFYVVADGAFDVVMSERHIRTARRGDTFGEVALLADVPRTATVIATQPGVLLSIERVDFLTALTGSDTSRQAAWGVVRGMELDPGIAGRAPVPDGGVVG